MVLLYKFLVIFASNEEIENVGRSSIFFTDTRCMEELESYLQSFRKLL